MGISGTAVAQVRCQDSQSMLFKLLGNANIMDPEFGISHYIMIMYLKSALISYSCTTLSLRFY
jgi:hypothetical protein